MAKDIVDPEATPEQVEQSAAETGALLTEEALNITEPRKRDFAHVFIRMYAVVFFINIGMQMIAPAQIQIYERIYCSEWYNKHPADRLTYGNDIPEALCKIPQVQQQVSTLKGWQEFFGAAPALLVSVPVGMLTDVYGRRILAIVTISAVFLAQAWAAAVAWFGGSIPLEAIWLGSIFTFFGGGAVGAELLMVCVLTDISTKESLTVAFFRVTSMGYFAKVIGPVIAATLMRYNPWLAIYIGLAFLFGTSILMTTFPETLASRIELEVDGDEQPTSPTSRILKTTWKDTRESLKEMMKTWTDYRLLFVALTYPFRMVCYALGDLIQRYVSDRYHWTLADATLLYSIQAISSAAMLFILLPLVSAQIDQRYSWSVIQKNVVLSRVSLLILVFAYAVIGLAPTAPIMIVGLLIETLATGLPATMRALASALVEGEDKGRVFSVLAVVETLSAMVAYPFSAAFFNLGLEKGGGVWLGLPYDVISIGAAISFLIMCLLRFERRIRV
ncbi:uncharacterized protein A1O9_02335 [Exophiala aquamarina CBS 119918]|uniref:Major facilitator superfamily (MFS) profile domain-containing protein n=1 Tax=Exophiala aquamarina CBS 119918 TaxID=1182545 RepID=A0A072PN95_9EURO|nr:uncharacterized protein A1O9_02335 [Exophiala aquamarina CBS 119918]KEF60773.1 hypothetical protein A1O9_02335 [Exophiala aquamarina CBS 119918]